MGRQACSNPDEAEHCDHDPPDQTTSQFDYAGPLTETVLLGTIAIRFPAQALEWNSEASAVTNLAAASALGRKSYRDGWEVKGLS